MSEITSTKHFYTKHSPSRVGSGSSTSLWVEFITLANECKAVNLGQGFTDDTMPLFLSKHLTDVASSPEKTEWHQYTRGYGHPRLVNILAKMYSRILNSEINPQTDVLITVGAYLSLYYAFLGWLNPGDEVIIFEPAYDSYLTQIQMAGGIAVPIVLELDSDAKTSAGYKVDFDKLRSKITQKTKMIVLNNPNNPTGKLFTRHELEQLAKIVEENDLLVVADEVYEWMVYPGHEMIRFATIQGMYNRTITIGSAGKAFSATGWKLGWSIAPKWLLEPLKRVHENCIFAASAPTQEALARAFEDEFDLMEKNNLSESYLISTLPKELVQKRDLIAKYLNSAGFRTISPDAGYFMIADFGHLDGPFRKEGNPYMKDGEGLDYGFVRWLCKEKRLASIPPSAFYSPENRNGHDNFIRLCFFKKEETLENAITILKNLNLSTI